MPADLIVYALVAAGLVLWLRNVLGTRHGEERDQAAPFLNPDIPENTNEPSMAAAPAESAEEQITSLAETARKNYSIDNKTAENGLLDISKADKNFDIDFFLEGCQDAFAMIVESFAEGDRETLKELLDAPVYNSFEAAIKEREERGETQIADIHAVKKASVIEAHVKGKMTFITVKFIADQTSVTRNKDGDIIDGHPDNTIEMQDIWTFGREAKSKDPSWLLFETRGDFEGDNDLIPDTH